MKWLISLFSMFVLIIAGLLVAPSFIDWNQYKSQAIEQVEANTGHKLSIEGDISLAILPSPRVYLEGVKIADPADPQTFLARLERLDVHVGLVELLQKQISVTSVNLEKPIIVLKKNAQGVFNFMTPELETLMNKGEQAQPAGGSQFQVAFNNVEITDGAFSYKDAVTGADVEISGLNLDLNAKSLQGPFEAQGSLIYGGQSVAFSGSTSAIEAEAVSTNFKGQYAGADIEYAGLVAWGEDSQIQGKAKLNMADLPAFFKAFGAVSPLKGSLSFDGFVDGDMDGFSVKDASLAASGQVLRGQADVDLKPLSVKANLNASDVLNFDQILAGSGNKGGQTFDLGSVLPSTLELPALGAIDIQFQAPGFIYAGARSQGLKAVIGHEGKAFTIQANVSETPGKGVIEAQGALTFAEKSRSAKTGKDIYSGPSATFGLKGQVQNMAELVRGFSGLTDVPLVSQAKVGLFDLKGNLDKDGLTLNESLVNLGDLKASVSGSLKSQKESERQILSLKAVVNALNLDEFSEGEGQAGGDPLQPLKTLSLPFDVKSDVIINSAVFQGQEIKGLKLAAQIYPNSLVFDHVGAQDYMGANAKISGKIGDLKALSGLDLNISGSSQDPKAFAEAFKVDTSAWPKTLGAASVDVKAKGNLEALNLNANVKALGGTVTASGPVANPLSGLNVNNLDLRIQHQSLESALSVLGIQLPAYETLNRPVDLKMNVGISGQKYVLKGISGKVSNTEIQGAGQIDLSGDKPYIGGNLNLGRAVLEDSKSKSGKGSSSNSSSKSLQKWPSAPLNSAWLHSMNADIDIAASSLLYEGWDMKSPSLKMTLQNGVARVTDLKAGLYDGQIGLAGSLSSTTPKSPVSLNGNVNIQNVNMEPLVQSFAGERLLKGKGRISVQSEVSGVGGSMAALIGALKGQGRISGSDIILDGIDVNRFARALSDDAKPGDSLLGLWKGASSGGSSEFDTLDGAFVINNGILNLQKLLLDGPRSSIDTTGNINLPKWTIATAHKMTVKDRDDVPPFTVNISGSLDNPGQTFAQGAINDYLQRKITRKLGEFLGDKAGEGDLGGVIGNLLGGQAPQKQAPANDNQPPAQQQEQQAPKEITPEDAVKDLIKGLF